MFVFELKLTLTGSNIHIPGCFLPSSSIHAVGNPDPCDRGFVGIEFFRVALWIIMTADPVPSPARIIGSDWLLDRSRELRRPYFRASLL